MSLRDLLYRCPSCGQDPVEGRKDRVRCPACHTIYERGGGPARIRVRVRDGEPRSVPAHRLVQSVQDQGGPFPAARTEDGSIRYESEARVRRARGEGAVHYRGHLLGFAEKLEKGRTATLRLADDILEVTETGGEGVASRWNVLDLRAVQASSSSLQIYTVAGDLVHFRFVDASPVRWEALLQGVLRRAYRKAGRGEIVEFQPRITVQ